MEQMVLKNIISVQLKIFYEKDTEDTTSTKNKIILLRNVTKNTQFDWNVRNLLYIYN